MSSHLRLARLFSLFTYSTLAGRDNHKEIDMISNANLIVAAAVTGLFAGAAAQAGAAAVAPAPVSQSVTTPVNAATVNAKLGQKATQFAEDAKGKHDCKGKNDCKGEGGCKSSDNGCHGKNSCKGKGGCNTKGTESKLA
jgi:hypothetical protein